MYLILILTLSLYHFVAHSQTAIECQVQIQNPTAKEISDGNFYFAETRGYIRENAQDPSLEDILKVLGASNEDNFRAVIPYINSTITYFRFTMTCSNGDTVDLSESEQKDLQLTRNMIFYENNQKEKENLDQVLKILKPKLEQLVLQLKTNSFLKKRLSSFLRTL